MEYCIIQIYGLYNTRTYSSYGIATELLIPVKMDNAAYKCIYQCFITASSHLPGVVYGPGDIKMYKNITCYGLSNETRCFYESYTSHTKVDPIAASLRFFQ